MADIQVLDAVKLSAEFKDDNNTLFDPVRVEFSLKLAPKHNSTLTTYIHGTDTELVKDSTGKYHVIWYVTVDDKHSWGFYGFDASTGGNGIAAEEQEFKVKASKVR